MGRLAGTVRHDLEQEAWQRSPALARRLLTRDLETIDRYRSSGRTPAFFGHEGSTFSQNGEDGILQWIFDCVGETSRYFVEIGAADGSENCTRNLAEHGWSGVWIEGSPELATQARALPVAQRIKVVDAFITTSNAVTLLSDAGVPTQFDLLSLDIDGNDYWVMERLLGAFRPRVIVAEYNGANRFDWASPYLDVRDWDRSWNFGSSLSRQVSLMEHFGYRLVGCDGVGVNSFFVRGDVSLGGLVPGSAAEHYVPPVHRPGTLGHPRSSPLTSEPIHNLSSDELAEVKLRDTALVGLDHRGPGERVFVITMVDNRSSGVLASVGDQPVYLTYRTLCLDQPGFAMGEPARAPLASVIHAGERRPSAVQAILPVVPGEYSLVPTLVQEFVSWRTADPKEGVRVIVTGAT